MKELIEIQSKLKVAKNQRNNFGNYNYRSCEDILENAKQILKEQNCLLTISDDIAVALDRVYIKSTATIRNSAGDTISNTAFAREPFAQKGMSDSQITGATSSYARKYALAGLFALDDTIDTDSQDNSTAGAIETIGKLIKETSTNEIEFFKYFKINSISEMNFEQQQKAIKMLNEKKGR